MNLLQIIDSSLYKTELFPFFDFTSLYSAFTLEEIKDIYLLAIRTIGLTNSRSDFLTLFFKTTDMKNKKILPKEITFAFNIGSNLEIIENEEKKVYTITIPRYNKKIILYNILIYIFIVFMTLGKKNIYEDLITKISELLNGR